MAKAKANAAAATIVEEEETVPFEVTDAIDPDEVGDLTDVKRDDTIPQAKDVHFFVRAEEGAKVETRYDKEEDGGDGSLLKKLLRIQAQVGPNGIDGTGAFADRIVFADLPLVLKLDAMKVAHDRRQQKLVDEGKIKAAKPFNEKWHKDSLVDFKEFALATGLAEMLEDSEHCGAIVNGKHCGVIGASTHERFNKPHAYQPVAGTGQPKWQMTSPIDDEMLSILASGDVEFIANLSRTENKGMDRWENKLSRFRAPSQEE